MQHFSLWFPTVFLQSSSTFPLHTLIVTTRWFKASYCNPCQHFFSTASRSPKKHISQVKAVKAEGYHLHHQTNEAQDLLFCLFPYNPHDFSSLLSTDISTVPSYKAQDTNIKNSTQRWLSRSANCNQVLPSIALGQTWDACTWEAKLLC